MKAIEALINMDDSLDLANTGPTAPSKFSGNGQHVAATEQAPTPIVSKGKGKTSSSSTSAIAKVCSPPRTR